MANKVMGEIEVEIAGEPRVLGFDFEVFQEIGDKLGLPEFHDVVDRLGQDFLGGKMIFSTLFIVLAAALRANWPEVTVPMLRRALKPKDMDRVAEALVSALNEAMPKPAKGDEKPDSEGNAPKGEAPQAA